MVVEQWYVGSQSHITCPSSFGRSSNTCTNLHVKGIPVKSQLVPPAKNYMLNVHRDSNPFSCDGPANWSPTPSLAESDSKINAENPPLPPRAISKMSFLENRNSSKAKWLTDDQYVFEQRRRDLDSPSVSIEPPKEPNANMQDLLGGNISDNLNWRPLTPE